MIGGWAPVLSTDQSGVAQVVSLHSIFIPFLKYIVCTCLHDSGKTTGSTTDSMEGILEDALNKPVPELVVFIVYDLPNRDCHAKASNGEDWHPDELH